MRQEEEEEQMRLEEEKEYATGFCVDIQVPVLSVDNEEIEYMGVYSTQEANKVVPVFSQL